MTDSTAFRALKVIATDQKIRDFLAKNDPSALEQVESAIDDIVNENNDGDVVSVAQEAGWDGPWTARCTCGWTVDRFNAWQAQNLAHEHGEETGHDDSNA